MVNGTTSYCRCPIGYELPYCTSSQNPCFSNPCKNGGTCRNNQPGEYQCDCTPSYTGRTCEMETNACGGVLASASGTLKYPISDLYPHNSRCAWLIRTIVTQVLNVTFTNFDIEYSTNDCRFDWLQVIC